MSYEEAKGLWILSRQEPHEGRVREWFRKDGTWGPFSRELTKTFRVPASSEGSLVERTGGGTWHPFIAGWVLRMKAGDRVLVHWLKFDALRTGKPFPSEALATQYRDAGYPEWDVVPVDVMNDVIDEDFFKKSVDLQAQIDRLTQDRLEAMSKITDLRREWKSAQQDANRLRECLRVVASHLLSSTISEHATPDQTIEEIDKAMVAMMSRRRRSITHVGVNFPSANVVSVRFADHVSASDFYEKMSAELLKSKNGST